MATTVTPGTPVSFPIGAFDTITVTASPASVGTVSFTAGALSDLRSDVSAGVCNNIYGPYGVPGTVTISVTSGVVAYTPNYARGSVATTTAATAAATAYQGAGVTLVDEDGAQWAWSGSAYERGAGGGASAAPVEVTVDATLTTADAGKTFVNNSGSAKTLTLVAGLGAITLVHGTQPLIAAGSPLQLSGVTQTSSRNARVTITEKSSGVYVGTVAASTPATVSYSRRWPAVTTNKWILIGDSRCANSATDATTYVPANMGPYGIAYFTEQYAEHRGEFVGLHAVNSSKIQNAIDGLTGSMNGVAGRGSIVSNSAASGAKIAVILIGVNGGSVGGTDTVAVCAPLYRTLINDLLTAGFEAIIVCDELPNNNFSSGSNGTANINRAKFLRSIAQGFPDEKVVVANTYNSVAVSTDSALSAAGFYPASDLLHPAMRGNKAVGRVIGETLGAILAQSGYKSRAILPLYDNDPTFAKTVMFSGTSGTIGSGNSGQLASGWLGFGAADGLAVAWSKGVDEFGYETQLARVFGTTTSASTAIGARGLVHQGLGGAFGASDTSMRFCARVKIKEIVDATAFFGVGLSMSATNTTDAWSGSRTFGASTAGTYTPQVDEVGFGSDYIDWPMTTQKLVLNSGWTAAATKSIQPTINLMYVGGNKPMDITFEISRGGFVSGG